MARRTQKQKPAPLSPFQNLKVEEVACFLRVSPGVIYALVGEGDLPAVRIGNLIRIPRQAFLTWLAASSGESGDGGKDGRLKQG